MAEKKSTQNFDVSIFLEELKKRIDVSDEQLNEFLKFWEFKKFKRNEFILKGGEVHEFSIFVLKGCLRQYLVNESGEESIVYFAEERHFIGDLPSIRNKIVSNYNFQAIEECELLVISSDNWERAFIEFPWWAQAHLTGYQKWATLLQQQISERQTLTGETRYLNLLKTKPKLFQRVPQHFIASYLGISAETLSRIRKKLVK